MTTKNYEFAKRVTAAKVRVTIYDGQPHTPDQIVQVCRIQNGQEVGFEVAISPDSSLTIGEALDMALAQLLTSE